MIEKTTDRLFLHRWERLTAIMSYCLTKCYLVRRALLVVDWRCVERSWLYLPMKSTHYMLCHPCLCLWLRASTAIMIEIKKNTLTHTTDDRVKKVSHFSAGFVKSWNMVTDYSTAVKDDYLRNDFSYFKWRYLFQFIIIRYHSWKQVTWA